MTATTMAPAPAEPTIMRGSRLWLVFTALLLGMLLSALDQTIVSTALPTIVSDLGGLNQRSWVVTAYLLASTASMLLWGKVGDLYGRKPIFIITIVVFLAGSALSGIKLLPMMAGLLLTSIGSGQLLSDGTHGTDIIAGKSTG